MDLVFPKNNEKEFLKKAKELDKEIMFVYPFQKKQNIKTNQKYAFLTDKKVKPYSVYLSKQNDRAVFEKGVNLIYGLELSKNKDFIFHRNSGMNQVLAKIAQVKNITIGFSFTDFLKAKNKAVILGRMQQNYKLCKKYKVKTLFGSFAHDPEELQDKTTLNSFKQIIEKRKLF